MVSGIKKCLVLISSDFLAYRHVFQGNSPSPRTKPPSPELRGIRPGKMASSPSPHVGGLQSCYSVYVIPATPGVQPSQWGDTGRTREGGMGRGGFSGMFGRGNASPHEVLANPGAARFPPPLALPPDINSL